MTYIPPLLDVVITGQGSQLAINQNVILATAGTGNYDTVLPSANQMYRSWSIQITPAAGTVTAGVITFEASNDGTNFTPIFMIDEANITSVPVSNYTIAASTTRYFKGVIAWRFVRARISTGITGTTTGVQAFTRFTTEGFADERITVTQATAASLNANVSGTVTATVANATLTAGTVTGATLGIPLQVVDVASAALTTTTTTGTITPSAGAGYQVFIPVTAVSGTTPSLTIAIEESMDAGTTWFNRVTLTPITATGSYYSPYLKLKGNRVRYVQTVSGTTPSFTRAIIRLQGQSDLNEGTAYKLVSAASTNATLVKAGPTTISMLTASNINASPRYLKLYDLGVAPTVGTSVPTHTFIIPGNASGAGTNIPIPKDLSFTRGFALALTTEATDAGSTGVAVSEIVINAQIS